MVSAVQAVSAGLDQNRIVQHRFISAYREDFLTKEFWMAYSLFLTKKNSQRLI